MFNYISVSYFLGSLSVLLICLAYGGGLALISSSNVLVSSYFIMDSVSYYLVVLVVLLGVYSQLLFSGGLSYATKWFLGLSLIFSACCFCCNHSVLFWCFYELSMLPLLYLIFKDSPYSERFLAGWYFLAYLTVTSLPLILIILYLSYVNDSFFFSCWVGGNASPHILLLLCFVFFTKVPLVPFHTWLPIVHAEASSIVSIFLSGYIMKLGLLGVYRCTYFMFNSGLVGYLWLCCVLSIFFLATACGELDGKRWLAFLSLAHIVVPFFSFFVSDWAGINLSFLYCLGHGLSAGLIFGLLWYYYDLSNSRNWLLLKSCVNSSNTSLLVVLSMLTLCSFPTTIQFFCEVYFVTFCSGSVLYLVFWGGYLFLGGLVPLILCGHLIIRSECFESYDCGHHNYSYFLVYLLCWCYAGIFLL